MVSEKESSHILLMQIKVTGILLNIYLSRILNFFKCVYVHVCVCVCKNWQYSIKYIDVDREVFKIIKYILF